MNRSRIFLTGGSGNLGTELKKYLEDVDAPTHKELDLTKPVLAHQFNYIYRLIVHAAAYTDVAKAETDRDACYKTNVIGTLNLLRAVGDIPFVYISTEYCYEPVNYYTWTKLEAEKLVEEISPNYLIIRTLFKPRPFPHPKAAVDQYTRGDYVDVMAPLIAGEIENWHSFTKAKINVGTGLKTTFELARMSRPDVKPCTLADITNVKLPTGRAVI